MPGQEAILGTLIGGPKHGDTEQVIVNTVLNGLPLPRDFTYTSDRGRESKYIRGPIPSKHKAYPPFTSFYYFSGLSLKAALDLLNQAVEIDGERKRMKGK